MLTLIQAANAAEPVSLAGREYPVRQLRVAEWATLQSWLKASAPCPVKLAVAAVAEAAAGGKPFPRQVVEALYSHAQAEARAWPPPVGSRAWLHAVDGTAEGSARFVQIVLHAGGTDLPLEECVKLAERAAPAEMSELLRVAYFGDPPSPKSPAGTTTATTSKPKRTRRGPTTGGPSSTGSPSAG